MIFPQSNCNILCGVCFLSTHAVAPAAVGTCDMAAKSISCHAWHPHGRDATLRLSTWTFVRSFWAGVLCCQWQVDGFNSVVQIPEWAAQTSIGAESLQWLVRCTIRHPNCLEIHSKHSWLIKEKHRKNPSSLAKWNVHQLNTCSFLFFPNGRFCVQSDVFIPPV